MTAKTNVVAGLVLAAAIHAPALAEDRLTPLLRFVPAEAVGGGEADAVQFVDVAGLRESVDMRLSLVDAFSWSAEDRWMAAMFRITIAPNMLAQYMQHWAQAGDTMADYLGFGWEDIGTAIGFGQPPILPLVLTGTAAVGDAQTIGNVLEGRGFGAEERNGVTIWWRGEDNAMDIANADPADPLRGSIGGSARAGVVDGAFVATSSWPLMDALLAASAGVVPTLAESADFVALSHALNQPVGEDGTLLQAYLFADAVELMPMLDMLGATTTEELAAELERQMAEMREAVRTPRYQAMAIADRQEGAIPIGLVAMVFHDRAAATLATETVPAAIAALDSLATRRPFVEVLPYDIATDVVAAPGGDRFVARIAFVQSDAEPLEAPATANLVPVRRLMDMLYRRDFAPFATGE